MIDHLLHEALEAKESITAYRRKLHACAETGFDLPKTVSFVSDTLTDLGYEPQLVGRRGLVATIGNGSPSVLLRADMDALPVMEETDLPYASTNGNMHACGHDMHTAMLLGAAALLRKHESELNGCVKLMFQPAEEILEGAADMLANGLLADDECCMGFMMHVMSGTGLKTGTVVVPEAGVSAPAADMFRITVQGKGCHGAMPHMGIDPVNAGAHILLALQTISARELGANEAHALTIGSFRAGEAANAIPHEAILLGSARSYDQKTQKFLKQRIETVVETTADAFRAKGKVQWLSGCPPLVNDRLLVQQAQQLLPMAVGEDRVLLARNLVGEGSRSVGSEDFAYISQRIPSLMLAIAAGGENPLHHPSVVFDENALPYGATVYAAIAVSMAGKAPGRKRNTDKSSVCR